MVQMMIRSSLHLAEFSSPSSLCLGQLVFFLLLFLLLSVLLLTTLPPGPLLPVHVPSLLWAVLPFCSLFVAISVGKRGKKVPGNIVNVWFSPHRWEVVAEVSKLEEEKPTQVFHGILVCEPSNRTK